MNKRQFCKLIAMTETHFYATLNGRRLPSGHMAINVEKATNGKVRAEDFLYECMKVYKEKNPLHAQGEN
jgi:hypothetical protein